MSKQGIPDYIFETSWEVCNKVGGIYTVLSSKANNMVEKFGDHLVFIGPDLGEEASSLYFSPTTELSEWVEYLEMKEKVSVRVGRWKVKGSPLVVLVDFRPFYRMKNDIYGLFWKLYQVNSLPSYGDYDESGMFGYASGFVINSYYSFYKLANKQVVAHFDEWMTVFGLLFLKTYQPSIATMFTTHATTVGRSIAGNGKPLYNYLNEYNGDQMAQELNVVSKHSAEKTGAWHSDCFTTVSNITARECTQLLCKRPDVVTPNGFDDTIVPKGDERKRKRMAARSILHNVAEHVLGYQLPENAIFVCTSGRYEFKNKGIDVFLQALKNLSEKELPREVVAFVLVPAWTSKANGKLLYDMKHEILERQETFATHDLVEPWNDPVLNSASWLHLHNEKQSKVKLIFIPSYLNGHDGIINMNYYDVLMGMDVSVFPSYYEPWGYTPLESIAYGVPTITTNLAGFGDWVRQYSADLVNGVGVVLRSDYNFDDASEQVAVMLADFASHEGHGRKNITNEAQNISKNALWSIFIDKYCEAYQIALQNCKNRNSVKNKSINSNKKNGHTS